MAGYIGSRAVSVNTTSATITDDLTIGDDLTVTDDMTVGGTLGVTGVLTATSLDISGDIDVDGTTNLDVVDIDGAVDMASTLDVSGNLGIGTTATTAASSTKNIFLGGTGNIYADAAASADASLSISQNAKVDADNSWEYIVTDEASNYYQNAGYHVWRYAASGSAGADISWSEAMRIDSGRLLIGTTSTYFADADDLVVAGSGNQGITIASGTSNAGNIFFADGTSGDDRFRGIVRYDHSGNNMLFYTNGANERMRIDSSGKLRVGGSSSTMSNTLNVESTGFTLMGLKRTSGVTTGTGELAVHMETNSQTTVSFDDEGSFVFGTASTPSTAAGFSEKVRIDSSGNIKTTGGGKFVAGLGSGFATDADITLGSTAPAIFFHDTSSSAANAAIKVDSGVISFLNGSTGTNVSDLSERMRIDSSGNVLIGTNNNSQAVGTGLKSVLSNSNARHFVVGADASSGEAYSLYAEGAYRFYVSYSGAINSTSTSISSISDERLKENIVDLETGLTEIMALKPRRFDWKNGDGKNIAGFIAQEVETVLPDLIGGFKHDELDDAKALKMGDVIPTLVNAIQEQQTLIKTLTDRVTALES